MKFGLAEPKKTDKQIERLIYKTCRNLKDKYRKLLKKKTLESEGVLCDESDQWVDDNVEYDSGDPTGSNVISTTSKRAKKRLAATEDDEGGVAAKKYKKRKQKC